MKIYKLTPIDELNPCWKASEYTGVATVRADSEEQARSLAERCFKKFIEKKRENIGIVCPWRHEEFVSVEVDESGEHSASGEPELILPDSSLHA